ncbi:hypothetical protein EMIHUDRAFT_227427 [Emiliania huxleyi CCMP1516]|uniref:DNA polymerase zeta catalytic subunit N-terminal domain-containing protein n=2 Tax=Emiliania huxleyi TaxID=2903 RepID=A0A0D3KIR3_EMIH1|nr:hypothetical protein EMIHUDRAFT_227427 [Emiliania huxleyi CCMP1516]EOD35648.1 hypothetical protein EMIHUDRAFT_227427 [Emiliania huxleyi CCMP1516]|eukprot:XP_005788077.1 hypothetical protein EMIHUDRAFT_227427 [Emiliania huxleyi CCMP1516]
MRDDDPECAFAVRIVKLEPARTPPVQGLDPTHSPLTGRKIRHAPVMRVFGSTPRGQTACVHMHEAFPHLLVPGPHWLASAPDERVAAFRRRARPFLRVVLVETQARGVDQVVEAADLFLLGLVPPLQRAQPPPHRSPTAAIPSQATHLSTHPQAQPYESHVGSTSTCTAWTCSGWEGETHGLCVRYLAPRLTSCELELDAAPAQVLNARDVLHEPLSSARADVQMVSSLSNLWRDERDRRAALGLAPLRGPNGTPEGGTPAAEASLRCALPPARSGAVLEQILAATEADEEEGAAGNEDGGGGSGDG